MTDVRLDEAAVVVEGDLRVETGTIRTRAIAAVATVSGTEVKAQVLVVNGALRATSVFAAQRHRERAGRSGVDRSRPPHRPAVQKRPPIRDDAGREALRPRHGGAETGGAVAGADRRADGSDPPAPGPDARVRWGH